MASGAGQWNGAVTVIGSRRNGFARMNLPDNFFNGDILELEAYGADGESVCTRTFPIHYAKDYLKGELQPKRADAHPSGSQSAAASNCHVEETDTLITLRSSAVTVSFRKSDATITSVTRNADGRIIPLKDGPVAVGMKMVLADLSARMEMEMRFFVPVIVVRRTLLFGV